jgi:hypothetical protein
MKIEKRTRTITLALTAIITTLVILTASLPKPASAIGAFCQTCMPKESIIGNGFGDFECSNGISYPNTQINFNALVTIKVPGPAKGSVTLTATTPDSTTAQIQGTITSGAYDPSGKTKTYSLSGTSTSDDLCGIPNSPFTISGPTGNSVPISVTGGKYDFKGTGDVKEAPAKA